MNDSKMKILASRLTVYILILSVIIMGLSCATSSPYTPITSKLRLGFQETTVEEASEMLGVTVPAPTYLPKGLEIKEVYISYSPEGRNTILLFISDEEISKELVTKTTSQGTVQYYMVQSKMRMKIIYIYGKMIPGGFKLPGENVTAKGVAGKILEGGTLWWQPPPFDIHLSRSEDISKEELLKVAESIE